MKYVDDTDTGTDILSEINVLSEQITDTSNNQTPTITDVDLNCLTATSQQHQPKLASNKICESTIIKDKVISGKILDNRLTNILADELQTPLSSSLSRPASTLSVQSDQTDTSSISARPPLKQSYTLDNRHYQIGGSANFHVPWNNLTPLQSTAIANQRASTSITYSDSQFKFSSRPSSKLDYLSDHKSRFNNFYTRQSFDLNDEVLKERKDLRCADQTRCLLTLRRKAELKKRKACIDSYGLLDLAYLDVTKRFLLNSTSWNFNSFLLDTLSAGHSLSQLLVYFFCKYNFIQIYNLDMTAVWKCFRMYFCLSFLNIKFK